MTQQINVILARANWCGYCKHFEPIFEHSKNIYKNNDVLKELDINFEDYDFAEDSVKNSFMVSHMNAMDKIQGYPTVMVNIRSKNNNKYLVVSHTMVDEKVNEKNRIEEAAKRFIENLSNIIKSENSENKVLYKQNGGNIFYNSQLSPEEEKYRKKYLKYKSKYLKLKL